MEERNGEGDDGRLKKRKAQPVKEQEEELATLMCFSSLQTLLAMELCKDTTPPLDETYTGATSLVPIAFLKLMLLVASSLMQEEGRQCWKLQRQGSEWHRIERGVAGMDAVTRDNLWRRKYSMSYTCFLYIVEELRPFIQSESKFFVRAPLEIERAVALVLHRWSHGLSSREVAEKYNVGASTVGKYTLIVASALSDANKLYPKYVAIPSGDRMARITSQFQQQTSLPNICGAIDHTHVKLFFKPAKSSSSAPSSSHPSPFNFHSMILQAVCDTSKVFWDVSCKPSTTSEGDQGASHFLTSDLYERIKDGIVLQHPVISVEGKDVLPYMAGGRTYPIQSFCLKAYDSTDALRKAFDEQFRKAGNFICEAFAVLKSRWRILKCMNVHLMYAPQIAVACCVLHNICQLWGEPEPEQHQHDVESHPNIKIKRISAIHEVDEDEKAAGEEIRDALFRDWIKRSLDSSFGPACQGSNQNM